MTHLIRLQEGTHVSKGHGKKNKPDPSGDSFPQRAQTRQSHPLRPMRQHCGDPPWSPHPATQPPTHETPHPGCSAKVGGAGSARPGLALPVRGSSRLDSTRPGDDQGGNKAG